MTSLGDVAGAAPYGTTADDQPRGSDERPPTADRNAELCRDSITTAEPPPAPPNVDESVPVTAPTRLALVADTTFVSAVHRRSRHGPRRVVSGEAVERHGNPAVCENGHQAALPPDR